MSHYLKKWRTNPDKYTHSLSPDPPGIHFRKALYLPWMWKLPRDVVGVWLCIQMDYQLGISQPPTRLTTSPDWLPLMDIIGGWGFAHVVDCKCRHLKTGGLQFAFQQIGDLHFDGCFSFGFCFWLSHACQWHNPVEKRFICPRVRQDKLGKFNWTPTRQKVQIKQVPPTRCRYQICLYSLFKLTEIPPIR